MKRHLVLQIVIVLFVVAGTVIAGGYMFVTHLTDGLCKTTVHRTIPSPDGKRSLVLFDRDCGATTPFNTQASIATAGKPFSEDRNPSFFVVTGDRELMAKWRDDHAIEIAVFLGSRVVKNEPKVGDIEVTYK